MGRRTIPFKSRAWKFTAKRDAGPLYCEILQGNTKTPLTALSEMKLLWVFNTLIKNSYGYDYCAKALPTAMAQIDESVHIEQDVKFIALFLAASVLGELNDKCGFHFILKRYKTEELPLSVSIGVEFETEFPGRNMGNESLIKSHVRKLKKLLSPSKFNALGAAQKVTDLFDKPIKARSNLTLPKT